MKLIKKCPLFLILISTGILFTVAALGGRGTIYSGQEYHPFKEPILTVLFTGLHEEIYPWHLFGDKGQPSENEGEPLGNGSPDGSSNQAVSSPKETPTPDMTETPTPDMAQTPTPVASVMPTASPSPTPFVRPTPLRGSTEEEYLNHISADIYGDVGVLRAAEQEFITVDERYFDDALFIGDSRTVGLRDYTDLAEHADFLCETSLSIYKVMQQEFKGYGTVEEALTAGDYGKIYIMVGINELGTGTTENFMTKYTEVVDTLHELEPEAKIFIEGNMKVSGQKDASDKIFNNSNIQARNNAIATLADNQQIFYIDVNEAVCDEEGNLSADYTFDQIHLLGVYNDLWKQFLLEHGVE